MTFAATILTLYPEMFPGPLGVSLAGRAREEGKWSLEAVQIRDFAIDKHRTVDDTPAGGGAGMVLRADVLGAASDYVRSQILPGTGRGTSFAGGGVQASGPDVEMKQSPHVPLHHPADGPPRLLSLSKGGEDLRTHIINRGPQHIGAQHHPRAAASRSVIDGAMLIDREIANLHRIQRPLTLLPRPPRERYAQRPGKHLGVEGEDGGGEGHGSNHCPFSITAAM